MIGTHRSGIIAVLLAVSGLTVGCCDKEKKQIQYLTQQNIELGNKNKDLQGELVKARTRESQLLSQADSKDLALTAIQTENIELKKKAAAGTTAPAAGAVGGETTVFTETVGSDVLFAPGRATLTAAGRAALARIVSRLRSQHAGMSVRVYGYTDSDPIRRTRKLWQDNLDLSANRAMAVTRYLRSKGINAGTIETVAMGATNFISPNTTKAGKTKNRRVVIQVVRK